MRKGIKNKTAPQRSKKPNSYPSDSPHNYIWKSCFPPNEFTFSLPKSLSSSAKTDVLPPFQPPLNHFRSPGVQCLYRYTNSAGATDLHITHRLIGHAVLTVYIPTSAHDSRPASHTRLHIVLHTEERLMKLFFAYLSWYLIADFYFLFNFCITFHIGHFSEFLESLKQDRKAGTKWKTSYRHTHTA